MESLLDTVIEATPDVVDKPGEDLEFDLDDFEGEPDPLDDVIVLGNYTYRRNKTKRVYSDDDLLDKPWTEDEIVDMAYKAAGYVYSVNEYELQYIGIDRDDFLQEAVIHIVEKFRANYFPNNLKYVKSVIYRLINGFLLFNMKLKARVNAKRNISLNSPIANDGEGRDRELVDVIPDTERLNPEEEDNALIDSERAIQLVIAGKEVVKIIVEEELSFEPFKTSKYTYQAYVPKIANGNDKRPVRLSEKVIGQMLLAGYTRKEIANLFGEQDRGPGKADKYYSHNSAASYVAKAVTRTIEKIKNIARETSPETGEQVEAFFKFWHLYTNTPIF